jgi:hypothetical protein
LSRGLRHDDGNEPNVQHHHQMTALGARLQAGRADAYVHAVGIRNDDGLLLRYVRAVVGAEPPEWQEKQWTYEHMAFVSLVLPAADLVMLAESGSADRRLQLGATVFTVPEVSNQAPRRLPSFAKYDRAAVPWPTDDYEINSLNQHPGGSQLPGGFLIAPDAPSFPDPHSAFRAFFDGDFRLGTAWTPPSELALIRWADTGAYLGDIHATPTRLTVDVRGDHITGCLVELAGVEARITQQVERAEVVTFQLRDGLPSEAWVWLKRQTSWCDYRALATPWGNAAELHAAGVKIDVPVDPATEVETLIASGEGPHSEFKSKVPESPGEIRNLIKTVAAFANGSGGTILFGIDPDEITRLGVDGDLVKERDRIGAWLTSKVIPIPQFAVGIHSADGKTFLTLDVQKGSSPPYGIAVDSGSRNRPEFYVRRGASTSPAQPSDLREATLSNAPLSPERGRGSGDRNR